MECIKIVVVGDPGAGKTSLIRRYVEGAFDPSYNPTIYDKYEKIISYKGKKCMLVIEDTAGQAEYARLRSMQYNRANIVVLCFALADNQYTHTVKNTKSMFFMQPPAETTARVTESIKCNLSSHSYENITSIWLPEVNHFCSGHKHHKILVGTKKDLRTFGLKQGQFLTESDGKQLAKRTKSDKYIECSSSTGENINQVINAALELYFEPPATQRWSRVSGKKVCRFL